MNNDTSISAMRELLNSGILTSDTAGSVLLMLRKEKEKQVLQVHKYKIGGPYGHERKYYTTRCPWVASKKLKREQYNDLIDSLYEHYFGNPLADLTVQQMYEQMITYYADNHIVSTMTLAHYKADWHKYMEEGCEWLNTPIKNVLPGQIFEYYQKLTADCKMKKSSFTNLKTVINAVFDFAINRNVSCVKASLVDTKRLKYAPTTNKWEGVYTDIDKKKILDACEGMKPTVYIKAIELMFCLDVRIGELRALYKEDVDLNTRTIYIGHQMVDRPTEAVNRHSIRIDSMKGGKDAGKRTQPLCDRAISVIKYLFETYPDTEWLLPSKGDNSPIRMHRFNDNLKKICEKAGVKYFSSHGIRFHNISALYDADISEKEIQRLSGHTTSTMTRYYNRSIKKYDENDKIRDVLG